MTQIVQVKPFFEYNDLVQRLIDRGMLIKDPLRAQRKLTQVGYYRLSGYWHTSRKFKFLGRKIIHENNFQSGTCFESIFELYLFDKRLRVEFTDALERIEIYLRTIIAHEIGRNDPLAYLDKMQFQKEAFKPKAKIHYSDWLSRHNRLMSESKEDSIEDHRAKGKPIPIWVAAEAWDFGALSKFYSILSVSNQDLICNRLGLNNRKELDNWLINLNGIRNRCAHHSRLSNRSNPRTLKIPCKGYFNLLGLDESQKNKISGIIAVMWFLLKRIGPSSTWICRIADSIDQKPNIHGFTYKSMGFPMSGFPRKLFPETIKPITVSINAEPIDELENRLVALLSFKNEFDLSRVAVQDKERFRFIVEELTAHVYELDAAIDGN